MRLFEYKLNEAVDVVCENIEKKWPYIEKQLLRAFLDIDFPPGIRNAMLSGYIRAVREELKADPQKQRVINYYNTHNHQQTTSVVNAAKEDGIPRNQRPPTRREFVLEYFKTYLVQTDPVAAASSGRKTPYVNHILRWLLNGSMVLPADISQINELLVIYQKLKHNQGQEVPDLDTINDPNKLRSMLMEYGDLDSYHTLANKKLPSIVPGIEVYRIDTWSEGKDILCDSGWCVRDREYFDDYKPPFYVFVATKSGGKPKRLALLNIHSGELKDVYNNELSMDVVGHIAPILDEIVVNYPRRGAQHAYLDELEALMPSADMITTLAPIIHLMPKTVSKLYPYQLAEMAGLVWSGDGSKPPVARWPEYMEKVLRTDPKSYIAYVDAVTGPTAFLEASRNKEFEDQLIDMAFVNFDEDFEFIVKLVEYFGGRFDAFGGKWPELLELLSEIKKHDLEEEFYKYLRHTNRDGMFAFLSLVGGDWSLSGKWPTHLVSE